MIVLHKPAPVALQPVQLVRKSTAEPIVWNRRLMLPRNTAQGPAADIRGWQGDRVWPAIARSHRNMEQTTLCATNDDPSPPTKLEAAQAPRTGWS